MINTSLAGSTPRSFFLAIGCLVIAGCDLLPLSETVKNPVAPPPPVRMLQDAARNESNPREKTGVAKLGAADTEDDALPSSRTADASGASRQGSDKAGSSGRGSSSNSGWKQANSIQRVNHEEPASPFDSNLLKEKGPASTEPLLDAQVAATVDGVPILVSDVLEPFAVTLASLARQYPPEELQKARRFLLAKHLPTHIEQQLLINALRTKLKEEQLKGVESQLDKAFAEEIQKMYKHYKVATTAELEAELTKQNTSLQATKAAFRNRSLAEQWMHFRVGPQVRIDRGDLLAYYKEHQADYESPARLKWQQISVSFEKHGGKAEALAATNKLLDELQNGAKFEELARKHSAGATAQQGGRWDWVRQGSFADQGLEKLLFDLSVDEIAGPYETKQGFDIVRVTERQNLTRKSFESVQDEIRANLRKQQSQTAATKFLKELREHATVEIMIKDSNSEEASKS